MTPAPGRFLLLRRMFASRSPLWTVEAASWAPYPLRRRWETTKELRGNVLAQVEGQLARGEQPVPRNGKQIL